MIRLLCFGDSNTWGYHPETKQRYAEALRWTGILQRMAAGRAEVLAEGLCGRTTATDDTGRPGLNGLSALPDILRQRAPVDAAVLMLGTNDCKTAYGLTAGQIAEGARSCLHTLRTVLPADRILLVSPIELGADVWLPAYDPVFGRASVAVSKQLKQAYRVVADAEGCRFLAASDRAQPDPADQEHLSAAGHAALADAIYHCCKDWFE